MECREVDAIVQALTSIARHLALIPGYSKQDCASCFPQCDSLQSTVAEQVSILVCFRSLIQLI